MHMGCMMSHYSREISSRVAEKGESVVAPLPIHVDGEKIYSCVYHETHQYAFRFIGCTVLLLNVGVIILCKSFYLHFGNVT